MALPESPTKTIASLCIPAIATLLAALCWFRGGVDPAVSATVFGIILLACAALLLCGPAAGLELRPSWPVAVVALLPVAQLVPLGAARGLLWPSWREDLTSRFAEFGVATASSVSIYPYATLQSAVVLAGCCALFVLSQAVVKSRRDAAATLAGVALVIAAAEAALGLWQAFGQTDTPVHSAAGAASQAQGTFGNRNHLAVLLEAGFCLALGLVARSLHADRSGTAPRHWPRLAMSAIAAALCLAGVVASGSRMGIIVACGAAVIGSQILFSRKRRLSLALNLAALLFATVLSFPHVAGGFERLLSGKGDTGRIAIWSDAVAAAVRYFPTGSGLGTFAFAFRRSEPYFPRNTIDHAHCDALEFLVELGLVGTLFLAAAVGSAFRQASNRSKRAIPPGTVELKTGYVLAAAAILLHSVVDFPLQIPALAALFAVMLGSAVGLANDSDPTRRPRRIQGPIAATACGMFAVVAAAVVCGLPRSWTAEALYRSGMDHMIAGEPVGADRLFQQSLVANPFAAEVWLKRAEAARASRKLDKTWEFLTLAAQLEPFTLRTEWPLAQDALRQRRWKDAAGRLRNLAQMAPDVQPAILRSALAAEMPPARIVQEIVPPEAAGVWLRILADHEAWPELDQTLTHWASQPLAASSVDLRYVFDRLFQRRQMALMKRLWRTLTETSSSPVVLLALSIDASSRALPIEQHGTPGFSQGLDDPFAHGFGFQWVSHPRHRARIRLHRRAETQQYIELDLHLSPARETVHLSRYIAVQPALSYVLEAQGWAENSSGGEVRLEVWSVNGILGTSRLTRGSTPQRMGVRFRTGLDDEVLRLRLVSKSSALKELNGRFYVGDFALRSDQSAATRGDRKQNAGG